MRNFSANLIAVASIFSLDNLYARAQLPRECFFVTDLHGPDQQDSADIISNLPTLMAMYKPGMKLQSVVAIQDTSDNNQLTGIQINLEDNSDYIELPTVGAKPDSWASQKEHFRSA